MAVAENLAAVQKRIVAACERCNRRADEVVLVAVSKRHPAEAVRSAFEAGQRVFGESYAQELDEKAGALADLDIQWRMIGRLQRNKARRVVARGAAIDSVDSIKLARALDRHAAELERELQVNLQVNLGAESHKAGVQESELDALVEAVGACTHLRLMGLMAIPPAGADPTSHFAALRAHALRHQLTTLSMGMSADLEAAIEQGATMVRVGTAIFGPRAV